MGLLGTRPPGRRFALRVRLNVGRYYPTRAKRIYGPFAPPETAVCVLPPEGRARGYYVRNSERYLVCPIAPASRDRRFRE